MEWYKLDVNDRSVHTKGGLQRIKTPDDYIMPLSIVNGLPRLPLRPYTDKEWDDYPHVFMTDPQEWRTNRLDHDPTDEETWYDALSELERDPTTNLFDEYGEYRHRVTVQATDILTRSSFDTLDDIIDHSIFSTHAQAMSDEVESYGWDDTCHFYEANEHSIDTHEDTTGEPPTITSTDPRTVKDRPADYEALRPMFGWLTVDTIKQTLERTTQYGRIPGATTLKRFFKSFNPALNIPRRNERLASDFVYSDTPAVDDGSTSAVLFVGMDSSVTDAYGIKTDSQFVNTLEDVIRERGAPTQLISDRAQCEIGKKVLDILRSLFISSWQSEPTNNSRTPLNGVSKQ